MILGDKQADDVLNHIQIFGSITPLDALNRYGCFRLSARIFNIRKAGYEVITNYETKGGKTYARYYLVKHPSEQLTFA